MQVQFIHYAPEFIETFRRDIVYGQIPSYFPYGLHVSVRPEECRSDLEWTEFVKRRIDFPARVPLLETLKYAHSVSLKPNAKIISFMDEGGLLEFTASIRIHTAEYESARANFFRSDLMVEGGKRLRRHLYRPLFPLPS